MSTVVLLLVIIVISSSTSNSNSNSNSNSTSATIINNQEFKRDNMSNAPTLVWSSRPIRPFPVLPFYHIHMFMY